MHAFSTVGPKPQPFEGVVMGTAIREVRELEGMGSRRPTGVGAPALGRLAGGIAHELRNPLNVIKTSAYCLRHTPRLTQAKLVEHLERIERQVEFAERALTALTNFAKLPPPEIQAASVPELVRTALEAVAPRPQIEVDIQVESGLPSVLCDRDQLLLVFVNLVRNACEAMPRGGRLSINARLEGGRVTVSIGDDGPGIPDSDLARVFDPFFTTKPRGLGLGLALARSIVEKHGGRIEVSSEPGRGSVFSVDLQCAGRGEGDWNPWSVGIARATGGGTET